MAETSVQGISRGYATICLPVSEDRYNEIVNNSESFRDWLDSSYREIPEVFPAGFEQGYRMKDGRRSEKQGLWIRRIELRDGSAYSVRPSFVMPYMTARTDDVADVLFLRKFCVPFWALARVFGKDPMYWYRLEIALGRNSIVGTTCRRANLPEHLLADEHHRKRDGDREFIATTVGDGCVLGAALSERASTEDLQEAYGVFREEAHDLDPEYAPKTVSTDGWQATAAAWMALFPMIVILRCFLHGWLKIRERGKHLGQKFLELSEKVWHAYHAPDRRQFSDRLEGLKNWASDCLSGILLTKVLDLYRKRDLWTLAYEHPGGHRTSNMLDRLMRSMNRYFDDGQHLHGSFEAGNQHCRAWALLYNFSPWHPATAQKNHGWQSPAERLNQHRYHASWLQNLLVSAGCLGYRNGPPQNP